MELARLATPEMLSIVIELAKDPNASQTVRLAAARFVKETGYGRAPQALTMSRMEEPLVQYGQAIEDLTDEQLRIVAGDDSGRS